MKAELILAWMLSLQAPGVSPYSAVAEQEGVVCDTIRTEGCRKETAAEGLQRYWTIAQSVAAVAPKDVELTRAVLTVVYYESGFRRDVHSGVGKYARGDGGGSWCIGQILLGKNHKRARRLVGIDRKATDRCIQTVARYLGVIKREQPYAKFARYGGVYGRQDKRILLRVRTYRRLVGTPPRLAEAVRRALRLEAAE